MPPSLSSHLLRTWFSMFGCAAAHQSPIRIKASGLARLGAWPLAPAPGSGLESCLKPIDDLARGDDGDALTRAAGVKS